VQLAKLFRSPVRWIVVAAAVVCGLGVGGHFAWRQFGQRVLERDAYLVRGDDIVLTAQPPWISAQTDVRAEVIRDASLDDAMSLLDERLTERIANAFALHPWIEKVGRVTKHHPARVEVHVRWRRPACMIEVDGRLEPVDRHGVLLPGGDFSPKMARRYPRVTGIQSVPVGPVGTPWGDPRVSGAARIAAALGDVWHELSLEELVASRSPSESPAGYDYTYDLLTRGGTRIHWGFSPETPMDSEPTTEEKVTRLTAYAAEHGTLDRTDGRAWDLSGGQILSARPGIGPR
jgi:hypothetical protein